MKTVIAAAMICSATAAHALQYPQPAIPLDRGGDPHVQIAHYDPVEPVLVVGAPGRPLTITFGSDETIVNAHLPTDTYGPDGKAIQAPWMGLSDKDQKGNVLPLWATRAGRSNIQVVTQTADHETRVYQFVMVVLPQQPDDCLLTSQQLLADCDDPRMTNGLSFVYPANHKVDKTAVQSAAQTRLGKEKLAGEERLRTDIFYGPRNWKYVIKGNPEAVQSLAPDQISDNTQVTGLLYLGNRKAPALYVVEAGDVERQVSPAPDKDLLLFYETAHHWRLRKGTQVADIYNVGFDPIGVNPQTGTISPSVVRVTRSTEARK